MWLFNKEIKRHKKFSYNRIQIKNKKINKNYNKKNNKNK